MHAHVQDTFKVDERRQVFYLAGQLYPEASGLVASLLGFDPSKVGPGGHQCGSPAMAVLAWHMCMHTAAPQLFAFVDS